MVIHVPHKCGCLRVGLLSTLPRLTKVLNQGALIGTKHVVHHLTVHELLFKLLLHDGDMLLELNQESLHALGLLCKVDDLHILGNYLRLSNLAQE